MGFGSENQMEKQMDKDKKARIVLGLFLGLHCRDCRA